MRIEIHAERFGLNRRLYRYIRRKVLACVGESRNHVCKVTISLTDVALSSEHIEKCCWIEMRLDGLPRVTCHQIDADAFRAIDRSTAQTGWLLHQALNGEGEDSQLVTLAPPYSLEHPRQHANS